MAALEILEDILSGGQIDQDLARASIVERDVSAKKDSPEEVEAQNAVRRLEELKESITSCDEVLARIQLYMTTFQSDLKVVTSDIESLQTRSIEMTKRLQNRRDLEAVLGPTLEQSVLSPNLIKSIAEAPVNRAWITSLTELETFEENGRKPNILKIEYPAEEVEKLETIAVVRIRDYLVQKIKSLRLPNANVHIIQQSGLLKMRKLYDFLHRHHVVLSDELLTAYCLTMKWFYSTSFERYQRALSKVPIRNISKQELLGAEDIPRSLGNMFSANTAKPAVSNANVMQLGSRSKYLHDNTSGIILAYLAETEKEQYFIERVFRSYIVALVENAAVEYLFMNEFFKPKGRAIADHFSMLFDSVFQAANAFVKQITMESLDSLGLLICIRVCQKLSYDLQKRKIAGLEAFLDGLQITLWPRLQSVMDAHSQAIQKAAVSVSSVNESARLKQALPITKKFSDLFFGILSLCKGSREEEPVSHSLDRLVHDFESCLTRMAATCTPKLRNQFLLRNYLHISEQIDAVSGPLAEKHKKSMKQFVTSMRT